VSGEVRWPFEAAPAIITVDGSDEEDNCICAEHAIFCDVGTIDGDSLEEHYVERPDGTWLACRIESWRERAERIEAELTATFAADTPWPLPEVLAKLAHAADTLFDQYNYDGHGYEEIVSARDAARAFLASFRERAQR
jgi:hypothetical protein